MDEMRRDSQQSFSLSHRLAHHSDLCVLEVANSAVHETRRSARRPACEIFLVDERDTESAHRCISGDAGAGNSPSNDKHIEPTPLQAGAHPRKIPSTRLTSR